MRVFWSWQSDVYSNECRTFIRDALVEAIKLAGEDLNVADAERPEIDHDTKGAAGMTDIADEILKKIALSAVFVADVTPITAVGAKALPNPNVLVELGYAMSKPGFERIIAVLNLAAGAKIEELPFDIRKRRVMTYELRPGATEAQRVRERKRLVDALTDALKTNLKSHLEEISEEIIIIGSPSKVGDPSLWESSTGAVECDDGSTSLRTPKATIPSGARAYLRVIPANWPNGPPSVDEISNLDDNEHVWPSTTGGIGSGSFGPCPEGYVRYWLTKRNADGTYESENVALYLDEPGEYWTLHGTGISEGGNGVRYISLEHIVGGWSKNLRRIMGIFDRFGAHPLRRVEVGLVGLSGVRWPGTYVSAGPASRKPGFLLDRQSRDWSIDQRFEFLHTAQNRILNIFALAKVTDAQFRTTLDMFDSGWSK